MRKVVIAMRKWSGETDPSDVTTAAIRHSGMESACTLLGFAVDRIDMSV